MNTTESAGGIVLNPRREVALVLHGHTSFWGFPKGHIDPGEDALTAAKREIHEETGIVDLELVSDLGSYDRYRSNLDGSDDTSEYKKIHMFLFTAPDGKLSPIDQGHPEARWIAQDDVEKTLTHKKDRAFFNSVRDQLTFE